MKQTLTFETEEYEDRRELKRVLKGEDAFSVLYDFSDHLRTLYKYGDDLNDSQQDLVEKIRDHFYSLLDDYEISLD